MRSETSRRCRPLLPDRWQSGLTAGLIALAAAFAPLPAIACDAPEMVELYSESHFSKPAEREAARQAAIRQGVVDALQRAAGAEIARGAQTATTSSLTSIEREIRDHLVIRSGGRVLGWEVVAEEDRSVEGVPGTTVTVRLSVEVCPSTAGPQPLVVAIGEPIGVSAELAGVIRAQLAERFEASNALAVVRDVPLDSYHDLRIELDHAMSVQDVDNSENAAILGRFRDLAMIDERALRFQLVSVTATLSAVRFVDLRTISQTIERQRRIALDAPADEAVAELLVEAAFLASKPLIAELDSGALDYAQR